MFRSLKDLINILARVFEALDALSEAELEKLLSTRCPIEIRALDRRTKEKLVNSANDSDVSQVISELDTVSTREDALLLLDRKCSTRKLLEVIARHYDIPIGKNDKVEGLRDKIVDGTIGARLRSDAIKGTTSTTNDIPNGPNSKLLPTEDNGARSSGPGG